MAGKKLKFVYNQDLSKACVWKVELRMSDGAMQEISVMASSRDRALLTVKEKYPGYDAICLGASIKTLISNEYGPF